MMYPFMTLDDDTEIVHSEMKPDGRVKVYLEKPDAEDCFHSAVCWLPGYDWQEVHGFTPEEIARYQKIVESTAHLILQFSQEGGVENAAGRRFLRLAPTGSTSGPTRTNRWSRSMCTLRRAHPTATPPRSGSPRRAAATCAIITLRSRPGYCATLWQLLKRAAEK